MSPETEKVRPYFPGSYEYTQSVQCQRMAEMYAKEVKLRGPQMSKVIEHELDVMELTTRPVGYRLIRGFNLLREDE